MYFSESHDFVLLIANRIDRFSPLKLALGKNGDGEVVASLLGAWFKIQSNNL